MDSQEKLALAQNALDRGNPSTAKAQSGEVLKQLPGHLAALLIHAQSLAELGVYDQSQADLDAILRLDPENSTARVLSRLVANKRLEKGGRSPKGIIRADAQHRLDLANLYVQQERWDQALHEFDEAEHRGAEKSVCDLGRCEIYWRLGKTAQAITLARVILSKNRDALKPKLILASLLGQSHEGRFLYQQATIQDTSGTVAKRLFGEHADSSPRAIPHLPVNSNEPDRGTEQLILEPASEQEIANVHLAREPFEDAPEGEPVVIDESDLIAPSTKNRDTAIDRAVSGIAKVARGFGLEFMPGINRPLELIVSNRQRLLQIYDQIGFQKIDSKLTELAKAICDGRALDASVVYLDSTESLRPFGVEPIRVGGSGEFQRVLSGLLAAVERQGKTIDSVLIIGNERLVPYVALPNLVFDNDNEVMTDALYVADVEHKLLPRCAVGRLPDDPRDIGFLLELIQNAILGHQEENQPGAVRADVHSFGLAADVWHQVAREVFSPIRNGRELYVSPPTAFTRFSPRANEKPDLYYYNLHGLKDSPRWLGQKDAQFFLALEPNDITRAACDKTVVFSEACYGAWTLGKTAENSIALRYLQQGALAFVGSTAVAYGAPEPPLACADILAKHFWLGVKRGLSSGQALVEAKREFAWDVMSKIGFLAADDQKTLHSFVLFGDPSLHPIPASGKTKGMDVVTHRNVIPNLLEEEQVGLEQVPHAMVQKSRAYVSKRMPELGRKEPKVAVALNTAAHSPKGKRTGPDSYVLAYDDNVRLEGGSMNVHFTARVMLTSGGKLIKVAVSK